jgi:hypothetical protein
VNNLKTDCSDGVALLLILGQLFNQITLPRFNMDPKTEVHKLDNLSVALKLLESQGIRLESITARMLLEGNEQAVLGLIWTLIKEVELKGMTKSMGGAKDPLLEWVRSKCGPRGVVVDNWTSSWADGRALLSLVSALRPDLVDFAQVGPDTAGRRNIERALDVGEVHLTVVCLIVCFFVI